MFSILYKGTRFNMSIQYVEASNILFNLVGDKKTSFRSMLYRKGRKSNIPTLQVLVTETLRYKRVIDRVLQSSSLSRYVSSKSPEPPSTRQRGGKKRKRSGKPKTNNIQQQQQDDHNKNNDIPNNPTLWLVRTLVYDYLFGKGKIEGGGRRKKEIIASKASLCSALARLKVKMRVREISALVPADEDMHPRYIRVNRLLSSPEEVISKFQSESYELKDSTEDILHANPKQKIFAVDSDWGEGCILMFPPNTDLHDHSLLKEGKIVLQGKSSCSSGYVLNPPPGSTALDSCAAPGMKTSQLAESMNNKGLLLAVDKDAERLKTLQRMTDTIGAKNITPVHSSFLKINPLEEPYSKVEYILCDPTCSGSGISSRLDKLIAYAMDPSPKLVLDVNDVAKRCSKAHDNGVSNNDEDEEYKERLASLADFQVRVVMHAMSFPRVKRIVYSTCSVNKEENEEVVAKVLASPLNHSGQWRLEKVLPRWKHRGWDLTEMYVEGNSNSKTFSTTAPTTPPSRTFTAPSFVSIAQKISPLSNCARMDQSDYVDGFFVSCFVRSQSEPEKLVDANLT